MEMSRASKRILFITGSVIVLLFAGVAVANLWPTPDCRVSAPQQINIVFDKTKRFSETQAHSVDRTLIEILTAAADNAEINLYYITANSDKPSLVFNGCKPSTRGSALLVDKGEEQLKFQNGIVKRIKRGIDVPYQPRSAAPIIESLATISRQRIVTAKLEQHTNVQFNIYSDMFQDSKGASLRGRRGSCAGPETRTLESRDAYADVVRSFRDVPVRVYGLYRDPAQWPDYPGERCVRGFWEAAFPHLTWMTL